MFNQRDVDSLIKKGKDLKEKFEKRKSELITLIGDSDMQIMLVRLGIPPKALVHIMTVVLNLPDTARYSKAMTDARLYVKDPDFKQYYETFEKTTEELEAALKQLAVILKTCEAALYIIIYQDLLTALNSPAFLEKFLKDFGTGFSEQFAKEIKEAQELKQTSQAQELVNAFKDYCSYFGKNSENIEISQCITSLDLATAQTREFARQIDTLMEICTGIAVQLTEFIPNQKDRDNFIKGFRDFLKQNNNPQSNQIQQWVASKVNNPDGKLLNLLQQYSVSYLAVLAINQKKDAASSQKKQAETEWDRIQRSSFHFMPPNFQEKLGESAAKFFSVSTGIIETMGKRLTSRRKANLLIPKCMAILSTLHSKDLPESSEQYTRSEGNFYVNRGKKSSSPTLSQPSRNTPRTGLGPSDPLASYNSYGLFASGSTFTTTTTTTTSSSNTSNSNNNNNAVINPAVPPPQQGTTSSTTTTTITSSSNSSNNNNNAVINPAVPPPTNNGP